MEERVRTLSTTERVVLLALVERSRSEATPSQAHDLRQTCREEFGEGTAVAGCPSEADVVRSLYRLEAADLVEEVETETTTTIGKGRPAYRLSEPSEDVLEAIDTDPLESDDGSTST